MDGVSREIDSVPSKENQSEGLCIMANAPGTTGPRYWRYWDESSDEDEDFGEYLHPVPSLERNVSTSLAPSTVSSVSDEFICGDCETVNISSRHPENPSFEDQPTTLYLKLNTPKENITTQPKIIELDEDEIIVEESCDEDEEIDVDLPIQPSTIEHDEDQIIVDDSCDEVEESIVDDSCDDDEDEEIDIGLPIEPSIIERDEDQIIVDDSCDEDEEVDVVDVPQPKFIEHYDEYILVQGIDEDEEIIVNMPPQPTITIESIDVDEITSIVDSTDNDRYNTMNNINGPEITENIVTANVFEHTETEDYEDSYGRQFISTKYPAILDGDLDFHYLKESDNVRERQTFCRATVRGPWEELDSESWRGEIFDQQEILERMSCDNHLWVIDERLRPDICSVKPPVCYMCGLTGHLEPQCPTKICLNCGSPNQLYSSVCAACCGWGVLACAECGQRGHPSSHCPDLWRRYHNTIDNNEPLERCDQRKEPDQLFCSGCAQSGHLIHACPVTVPFSDLPINSPYVFTYRFLYPPTPRTSNIDQEVPNQNIPEENNSQDSTSHRHVRNKRPLSLSPTHERQVSKKRR